MRSNTENKSTIWCKQKKNDEFELTPNVNRVCRRREFRVAAETEAMCDVLSVVAVIYLDTEIVFRANQPNNKKQLVGEK